MAHHLSSEKKSRFEKTPREWLAIGSQFNELANTWSERDDIVTFVGEGAGHGAPACFIPSIAEMEVNVGVAFGEGIDPIYVGDLLDRSIQFDHPVAMGAVMHEAFHAKHSTLTLLDGINKEDDAFVRGVATWFEETRIESRAVEAIPKNRAFLRSCALRIVIGDLKEDEDFASRGVQAFSQLMLLTLARVTAGVLDAEDVEIIHNAALKFFGEETLNKLESCWTRAQEHADDDDPEPLLVLAREWVEILKESGNDPADDAQETPDWLQELLKSMVGASSGEGEGEGKDGESPSSGPSILEKMAEDTEIDAQGEANSQAIREIQEAVAEAKGKAAAEAKGHKETAAEVFGRGTGPSSGSTSSRLVETRNPTDEERKAAVTLSKALEKARYRDRVVVKRSSIVPPGRLNARRALAASEQRSRGAEVTSEAWRRKQRFHTEDPELRIGVLVDISGSMSEAMEPMASTAWVLSEATRRVQGKCAMVYYGTSVFPTLRPGQHMKQVQVYTAPDVTEKFDRAFQALDGAMNLLNSSGARLLVIVSDLYYTGWEGERTRYWMKRCREAGVAVIVVPFGYYEHAKGVVKRMKCNGIEVLSGTATRTVVGAATAIGQAAVRQLEVASQ